MSIEESMLQGYCIVSHVLITSELELSQPSASSTPCIMHFGRTFVSEPPSVSIHINMDSVLVVDAGIGIDSDFKLRI
jgi:hypothetical protein